MESPRFTAPEIPDGKAEKSNTDDKTVKMVLNCSVKTRKQTNEEEGWTPWNGGYSRDQLCKLQEIDPDLGPLLKWKRDDVRPCPTEVEKTSAATRHYWHLWESIRIEDGLLFKQFHKRDGLGDYIQFLVPCEMKEEVLKNMHNSVMSGHLGKNKTKEKLVQRFYWYEMKEDIRIWISQCDICAANKPPQKSSRAPLGKMPVGGPIDRLATDLIGPLPITPRNNRYILTVTDYFTKWVEVFPVPDQTAATCANLILNEVICRFGSPLSVHSDQGRCYESVIFQELCEILDIRKTRTSPRNPKCNGQVERFNRSLISMVKSYLRGEQTNWDTNLGCLAGAYRASPHETTGLTPNLLMLGREIRFPFELTKDGQEFAVKSDVKTWGAHALKVRERLQKAHHVARKHLEVRMKRRKDHYDVKSNLISYQKFDKVWYLNESRKEGNCQKLQPLYLGPCLILKRFNDINYQIQTDAKGTTKVINHDKLKPYKGGNIPKWMKLLEAKNQE